MSRIFGRLAWAWVMAVHTSIALAGGHVFDSSFEERIEGPHSDAQSARFLTQATFGPDLAEISRVRRLGYNAWLAEQLALPASLHRPYLDAQAAAGLDVYQNSRQEAWWLRAIAAVEDFRVERVAWSPRFELAAVF